MTDSNIKPYAEGEMVLNGEGYVKSYITPNDPLTIKSGHGSGFISCSLKYMNLPQGTKIKVIVEVIKE